MYNSSKEATQRVDIEETNNLATLDSKRTNEMNDRLTSILIEMKASYPSYNPNYKENMEHKETVPSILSTFKNINQVIFKFKENGAKVTKANLIYTTNGGHRYEEWFKTDAKINALNNK